MTALHLGDVRAVNGNAAALRLVKAHQQVDKGGLARASWADNGNFTACFHIERDILHQNMVVAVTETDMLKADISFGCREDHRVCCIRHFFLFVQQLKYPFRCGDSALQGVYRVGNLCNRF